VFSGPGVPPNEIRNKTRVIDLDVDIGADAVDYKCVCLPWCICCPMTCPASAIANQESLSGLETEMRRLEGLVKEIVDEMGYLQKREERFAKTNCQCLFFPQIVFC
jgi:hypothetical protein